MSKRVYPSFRYHKELSPKIIHNEAQHELLESEGGWADTPAAFEEPKADAEPVSDLDKRLQDLAPGETSEDGEEELPEELGEDEIKAQLRERGVSNKQMKNKSIDELKAMLA